MVEVGVELRGLKALLARMVPRRENWQWLLVCLLLPPFEALAKVALFAVAGVEIPTPNYYTLPDWLMSIATFSFLRAGIGEEIGWRGFGQTQLQRTMSPFMSSFIIGLVWACWHYPKWFIVFGYSVSSILVLFLIYYTVVVVALSLIFGVIHNATRASLFAVILFHGSFDARSYVENALFAPNDWRSLSLNHIYTLSFWIIVAAGMVFLHRRMMFAVPVVETKDPANLQSNLVKADDDA